MDEQNPRLWAAIIGATVIKTLMSKNLKPVNAALTVIAGIYSGWAFTGFVMDVLGLEETTNNLILVACIVTITGENLLRQVINFSKSENMLMEILRIWLGKNKQ